MAVFECVERLNEPRGWLYKLWEVVVPGGLLVITTSHDWDCSKIETFIGKWYIYRFLEPQALKHVITCMFATHNYHDYLYTFLSSLA